MGGLGSHDRMLTVKRRKPLENLFFSLVKKYYAKILGETNFHKREFSQSGSKPKDGERKKEEDRKLVITMASCALETPPRVVRKPPGLKTKTERKNESQ